MITLPELNDILEAFCKAKNECVLQEALTRATTVLGFSAFAMGHHVDLSSAVTDAVRITSYNADWIDHLIERCYYAEDPIHLASTKRANGFSWSDVGDIIRLTPRHKQILTEAAGFGLSAGFTVPVHVPGEYHGSCSFAASSADHLHENSLPLAQLCGTFAFEAARRIMRARHQIQNQPVPDLTPRQLDALVLVGRGKTDGEIGDILGVSKATAHEHVEGARKAYGNAQRAFLIVRALFDGQIAFTDLLRN